MDLHQLRSITEAGETSRIQFKQSIESSDSLITEMIAFSNSRGGDLLVGVEDGTGKIVGITSDEARRISALAGNLASQAVFPPIFLETDIVRVEEAHREAWVLIIHIKEGVNKPHKDRNGIIWVKQGADKRKMTDNQEILRLFEEGGNFHPDELPIQGTGPDDLDHAAFATFFAKEFQTELNKVGIPYLQILENKNLLRSGHLTLAGLLFFGKHPQQFKPAFHIKAVSFFGNDIGDTVYRDSMDIEGSIPILFSEGKAFIKRNLRRVQKNQGFNTQGVLEVSEIAIEEVLQNALVHRNYLISAPIRILVFENRVEIISPGCLPNHLTVEQIQFGTTISRNPFLAYFCSKTLPYRGLGSGIVRALQAHPQTDMINDTAGQQFITCFHRPA